MIVLYWNMKLAAPASGTRTDSLRYRNRDSVALYRAYIVRIKTPASGLKLTGLNFVHIAPDPGLSGFIGTDQRMFRFVKMFGRMLILGRVATTHMSASETQAQVNPGVAGFDAVLAHMRVGGLNFDLVQVRAFLRHRFLSSSGKFILKPGQVTSVM
jgi:hypothetical protein